MSKLRGKVIVEIDGVQHVVGEGLIDCTQEQGVLIDESDSVALRFEASGQKRVVVRCWSGCPTFDAFEPETWVG